MPEGDTVARSARRLHAALAGRRLTVSDFRVPQLATVDLTGRRVIEVVTRGKHLLTRVDGGVSVHTHLRMEGSWHVYRPGARWSGGPGWQVRLVLANDDWQAVGYRLGVVELVPSEQEARVVGHLGPDVLAADWDLAEAVTRLRTDPARAIGEALLDQRALAGIGNLYRCEALFLAGVSPWAPVAGVADLPGLVARARDLVAANVDRSTQVATGVDRRGERTWVFERAGRPCRRCATAVAVTRGPASARVTYWCRRCQPDPAHPRQGRR
jgi:endonuclease-8